MPDGTSIRGVLRRGIDVSHWQQNVDWNQVAADDVDFVMLGTRYKGEVDPNFRTNATQPTRPVWSWARIFIPTLPAWRWRSRKRILFWIW